MYVIVNQKHSLVGGVNLKSKTTRLDKNIDKAIFTTKFPKVDMYLFCFSSNEVFTVFLKESNSVESTKPWLQLDTIEYEQNHNVQFTCTN